MGQSEVEIKQIIAPSDPNTVFLFVTYFSMNESVSDDFKIEAEITICYILSPATLVTQKDLYECIQQTKDHLQRIINVIFEEHPTPVVAPISFSDLSDTLDERIQDLNP